jgi:hypothetical protein
MPHTITVSDSTFLKLQQLAVPFVDTPESVVARLADDELGRSGGTNPRLPKSPTPHDTALHLDPDRHESLTHARLISASVDGKELHRPKWNTMLDQLHILGRKRLGSFDALRRVSPARLRPGRYEEEGYHFLPDADLSIQGTDANVAWDYSLGLARQLKVSVTAKFEWRHKDGAAHPGKLGLLEWAPTNLAIA